MSAHPEDKAENDRLLAEAPDSGMVECEWCGGEFFPDDMEGEHCRGCAEELFANDGEGYDEP